MTGAARALAGNCYFFLHKEYMENKFILMKRTFPLIALLLLSGCGAVKGVMSMTAGLVLPSKSDKMLKSNLKEMVEVTEPDMFGVNTMRKREVIHKEPFRELVAGIYVKPKIAELPEDGGDAAPAKKTPKYELSAEVNLPVTPMRTTSENYSAHAS